MCKEFLPKILPKKIRPNQWAFSSRPNNTNTQDEPLPPYPQRLRPPSPWKHPPWTRIISTRLPMSLLQRRDKEGSGGGTPISVFALSSGENTMLDDDDDDVDE